ncbi:diaminopimelate decarboxylase [Celerinatantimonas diazotrophica]|uniref:Diaminopimelate decarboxylase n=1 Tax=Celerinatantimonas diazotrophica TaxID=412034 RepID=A0A4R1KFB5_9GAMM|nr:diaminopimelate decarboxylase [Celerinatantimonas diazotrophica]TCK63332.1 diaminopimelate decarboxylase [Celerinatantimonas diazotrophica]CAG9298476.1 Diaminopimelate decarboxylase [Celerinatantimonas diazotrophica]
MDYFNYQDGTLCAEQVSLASLAKEHGTPLYVYSRATIERHWQAFNVAAGEREHLICYAVKANSNLGVLNLLARLGSGFDIVSGGELARVIEAGGDPSKVVFSGVGKTADEIAQALDAGIFCFNVESQSELERISEVATARGQIAPISLRINPDIDAKTHPYISTGLKENKFGIAYEQALSVYQTAASLPGIEIHGVDCHIGSQLTELAPFIEAVDKLLLLIDQLADVGISIAHLDVGGGLGVTYHDEVPPAPSEYAKVLHERLGSRNITLLFEPGRAIMANAGVLLTKVEYLKLGQDKNFALVDAAMNDLIRPALYGAWQNIVPVQQNQQAPEREYDVVGPVCETGDFLGKSRKLAIQAHDILAVRSAGAYGFVMSSNYNSRPRAAEILVDGEQAYVVRERETRPSLWLGEHLLPS